MNEKKFKLYDLRVTVAEIRGRSVCGLEVGDYFEVRNSSQVTIPPGRHFCMYAMASVLPLLPAKQRELAENDWMASDNLVSCPDPDEQVIMRIERLDPVDLDKDELT
jgi:uncharacterized repeat protein (TIGR04076 family)